MSMLLVAISTTLLCFLSCTACLRFIFSRQGWFWILPFLISAIFLYISIDPLIAIITSAVSGSYQIKISPDRSVREIVPLIIVLLWYTMIIAFRYALKAVVPVNQHLIDTQKNLHESRYLERVERRALRKKTENLIDRAYRTTQNQTGTLYPPEWVAGFDE